MFNTIRAVLIGPVLAITFSLGAAQDNCFPNDVAIVQTDTYVRESSTFVSRAVRAVKEGDSFAATGSTQDGEHCWIETSVGWLYSGYVKPKSIPALTPQATAALTSVPINEPIWSSKGLGTSMRPVSLKLTPGVYKLNVLRPINEARIRSITLGSNISEPENCFVWSDLSFPATIRMEQDCRLHSTLLVWIITRFEKTEHWEVSITKESDYLPPLPQAHGWSASGRGGSGVPVEVVFEPGVYRVQKQSGPDMYMFLQYQSPTYCVGGYIGGVPTQFKITQRCRAKVYVSFSSDRENWAWSFNITKLNDDNVWAVKEIEPTATPTSPAENVDAGCYKYAFAYVTTNTRIRASHNFDDPYVSTALAGESFQVRGSKVDRGKCWIKIRDGWLPDHVIQDAPPAPEAKPSPEATATTLPPDCYEASWAFVTGPMNIRAEPSTNSEIVSHARDGAVLAVAQAEQGESYCWLQVPDGWMAETRLVHSSIPAQSLPEIRGDEAFQQEIINALNFLRDNLPHWYMYVTRVTGRIEPAPPYASTSQAWATGRRITVHNDHLGSPLQAASILVHESCHFVQYNEGRRPGRWNIEARVEHEKECLRVELNMIEEIEPSGRLARNVRDTLNQPDWAFRLAMW